MIGPYRTSIIYRWLNDISCYSRKSKSEFLVVDHLKDTYYTPENLLIELKECNEKSNGMISQLSVADVKTLHRTSNNDFLRLFIRDIHYDAKRLNSKSYNHEDKENHQVKNQCFAPRQVHERIFDQSSRFKIRKLN